jgi:hypothetical protein
LNTISIVHRHRRRRAATTTATATNVVKLTIVHCQRKKQQQHYYQHAKGSTNVKMFTSPDNLGSFNSSTAFEVRDGLVEGIKQLLSC